MQAINEDLAVAFALSLKLSRPSFVGPIGRLYAAVLTMAGRRDEALSALDQAEAAYAKLGRVQDVAQVRRQREGIADGSEDPDARARSISTVPRPESLA
jgi:hypothetical protein